VFLLNSFIIEVVVVVVVLLCMEHESNSNSYDGKVKGISVVGSGSDISTSEVAIT
jgi:hypothetical protein